MDITKNISKILLQLDDRIRMCEVGSPERYKTRTVRHILAKVNDTLDSENLQEGMPDAIYHDFRNRTHSEFNQYTKEMALEIALTVSTLLASACENNEK